MRFRLLLGLLFLGICVLALGRILVQTARRPFTAAPRHAASPAFAIR